MPDSLFPVDPPSSDPPPVVSADTRFGTPRLRVPQRDQVTMRCAALNDLLESDHPARIVWQAVSGLDLDRWLRRIRAVEGHRGRDATDPRVLLALWVYATLDGVGSARELERLCEKHLAYQWLCGEVPVNHHMLSDFRSQHTDDWNELLTQLVGSLMAEGLVTMNRVAQDGMKVRASAGKSSFRRKGTLEKCLEEAREQVETVTRLGDVDPKGLNEKRRAARERAASERTQRVRKALENCEQLQKQREARSKVSGEKVKEARASTTDAESRVMQFSDGGYRPGWNVQFATDTASGIIVGVDVTNAGNDAEQLAPMLDELWERYGRRPSEVLADGGFTTKEGVKAAAGKECTLYGPLKEEKKQLEAGKDPYAAKSGDSAAMKAFRERMGTAAAKAIYKLRCQTAEWVNAVCRNHGLWQMPVRGRPKCRGVALLHAITHDLLTAVRLRRETEMLMSGG